MAELISTVFDQYSSFGLLCTLKDSGGSAVASSAISAISYSLADAAGEIINSRADVSLAAANPVLVEMEPDDTVIAGCLKEFNLYLQVTWIYTDSKLGAGSVASREYRLRFVRKVNAKAV